MSEPSLSAEAFAAAVERLRGQRERPVVVKLGGSAMEDPAATDACLRSVATLHQLRIPVVLVHGGGKPIDRAMAETGITPRKVAGRRYTDDATLEIVVRVLQAISRDLVARLGALGARATTYADAPSFPLAGERLMLPGLDLEPIDLGRVGKVTDVFLDEFRAAPAETLVVLPSLAVDDAEGWLNINADTAASAVAGALAG